MIKKIKFLFFLSIVSILTLAGYSQRRIQIFSDNQLTIQPVLTLIDGKGYLQATDVAEMYNLKLDWYAISKKLTFSKYNKKVIIFIDSTEVITDNIKRKLTKSPFLDKNMVMVPLELLLTRAFNGPFQNSTLWDRETRTLTITEKNENREKTKEEDDDSINILPPCIFTYPDYTKILIETIIPLNYTVEKDTTTTSIFLNIFDGKLDIIKSASMVKNGVIKNISAQQEKTKASLNIEFDKFAGNFEVLKSSNPIGIIVKIKNLLHQSPSTETSLPRPLTAQPKPLPKITIPAIQHLQTITKEKIIPLEKIINNLPAHLKIKTIVIDPGHGGKDPGAIGTNGTKEKDLVLDVAKRLAKIIKKRMHVKVILTRNDDTFIPLAVRTQMANEKKADLFISIHVNASLSPKTKGFEIYFLSEKASDKEAEAVANMENSVIAMEEQSPKLNELTSILWSMTLNKYMNNSSLLCSLISREVTLMHLGIQNRGVKQAAFHVLRGTKMPAVLVELGFLSNKGEERKLKNRNFRKKMTEAIYKGIFRYKKQLASK
jgi:N-acetylmuramoyl-L-alanine amidase